MMGTLCDVADRWHVNINQSIIQSRDRQVLFQGRLRLSLSKGGKWNEEEQQGKHLQSHARLYAHKKQIAPPIRGLSVLEEWRSGTASRLLHS
jgi:hypothetical protein